MYQLELAFHGKKTRMFGGNSVDSIASHSVYLATDSHTFRKTNSTIENRP